MASKRLNVMIDLETLSTEPNAAILSLGAAPFLNPAPLETFYARVDPKDYNAQEQRKFHISNQTLAWWKSQDANAQAEAFGGTSSLLMVLSDFSEYCAMIKKSTGSIIIPWSKGADFDLPIIRNAFDAFGISLPWAYYNHRCYRTLEALGKSTGMVMIENKAMKHNALEDAKNQALNAARIMEVLGCN